MIEREYHTTAYALAYNGMSPIMMHKFLQYAVESGGVRPQTVVVETYPYKLYAEPGSIQDPRLFNTSPSRLKVEILEDIYASDHDPSRIYNLLVCADNESIISAPVTYKFIEKLSYNGGYINKNVPGLTKFVTENELYETSNVYQQQYAAFADIIELCKQHGIRVIFVEPFVPRYVENGTNYNSAKALLRNLIAASGNIFLENNAVSLDNNDVSLFADFIHLSSKGRELWTNEVMRKIR